MSLLIYDDHCNLCSLFALMATRLSKGRIKALGHSSGEAKRIKELFFDHGERPEDMFWLIKGDIAYGGRSGLLPLLLEVVRGLLR